MAEGLGTNILLVTAPVETEARSSVMVVIPYKDALSQRRRSGKVSAMMPSRWLTLRTVIAYRLYPNPNRSHKGSGREHRRKQLPARERQLHYTLRPVLRVLRSEC